MVYVKKKKRNVNLIFRPATFSCGSRTASSSGTSFYAKWRERNASNTRVTGDEM